jgi:hypothetical protein
MYTFDCWVRLNALQTTHIQVRASDYHAARLIAEAQFGTGTVLNCTMINE